MAIVCRKCKYELTEGEINVYYWGSMRILAEKFFTFLNSMSGLFRKKIKDTPKTLQEKKLTAIANQEKITCPQCFLYNGWITLVDEAHDEDIDQN